MIFWDSSAIIPLCIDEPRTKTVQPFAEKDDAMVVWWGSLIECHSAFARLSRENRLTPDEEDQTRHLLTLLSHTWTEIEPSDEIRDTAERLLTVHPLRAADSLQLAAALIWAGKRPKEHAFMSLDTRLKNAAKKEGFVILPAPI